MADDADAVTRQLTEGAEPDRAGARPVRVALILGLVTVAVLGGLIGWLGVRSAATNDLAAQRELFLSAGRQGALDLTTIEASDADAAVQRILDSSTGAFHDDFKNNSGPFLEVLKETRSSSRGTVTEAAVESLSEDRAQVLVTVGIKTVTPGEPDQPERLWRMRIGVQKSGAGAKVSEVVFVN